MVALGRWREPVAGNQEAVEITPDPVAIVELHQNRASSSGLARLQTR